MATPTSLKHPVVSGIIIAIAVLSMESANGDYSGGAGTEPNPYRIGSLADWNSLAITTEDWDRHFILINDLDFGGVSIIPVGAETEPFTGSFNGDGHIIMNGTILWPDTDYIGLFCVVGPGGAIRNLAVENVNVSGLTHVGGLVGYNNGGTIESCHTTGTVYGENYYVGGLVGLHQDGSITSCYATGTVTADAYYVGGLVGENTHGVLTSCYATGNVSNEEYYSGGLVGRNNNGTILSCYSTGDVSAGEEAGGLIGECEGGSVFLCHATGYILGDSYIGGLIGYINTTEITSCYATGPVTGEYSVGGLIGDSYESEVVSCYARGEVKGNNHVGGLLGFNDGDVDICYSMGKVTGTSNTGGLIGSNTGTVTTSYWDKKTSGMKVSAGGEGRVTEDMTYPYAADTFVDWDFTDTWLNDTVGHINDGYPYLNGNVPIVDEGEGEPPTPHPADTNSDFRMIMGEAISYLSGWQSGSNPMAYAIRAAYLWQNGEYYVYESTLAPPLCWVLAP